MLLGDNLGEIGGSEYLATLHGKVLGTPPALDLAREASLQKLIVSLIREGTVESAHDCSEGGLAVALAECTFDSGGIGVTADIALSEVGFAGEANRVEWVNATLFGESASRIVVSASDEKAAAVIAAARAAGIPATVIGKTGGDRIRMTVDGQAAIDSLVTDAEHAWATAIEQKMTK